jgi:hypothetical protein
MTLRFNHRRSRDPLEVVESVTLYVIIAKFLYCKTAPLGDYRYVGSDQSRENRAKTVVFSFPQEAPRAPDLLKESSLEFHCGCIDVWCIGLDINGMDAAVNKIATCALLLHFYFYNMA